MEEKKLSYGIFGLSFPLLHDEFRREFERSIEQGFLERSYPQVKEVEIYQCMPFCKVPLSDPEKEDPRCSYTVGGKKRMAYMIIEGSDDDAFTFMRHLKAAEISSRVYFPNSNFASPPYCLGKMIERRKK